MKEIDFSTLATKFFGDFSRPSLLNRHYYSDLHREHVLSKFKFIKVAVETR